MVVSHLTVAAAEVDVKGGEQEVGDCEIVRVDFLVEEGEPKRPSMVLRAWGNNNEKSELDKLII